MKKNRWAIWNIKGLMSKDSLLEPVMLLSYLLCMISLHADSCTKIINIFSRDLTKSNREIWVWVMKEHFRPNVKFSSHRQWFQCNFFLFFSDGDLITIFDSSDLSFAIQCSRILKLTLFGKYRRLYFSISSK